MKIDLVDVFIQFLKRKRITFSIIFGFLLAGFILAFTLPKKYKAQVKILPPVQQGGFMGISPQTMAVLQGLGIQGIGGVNIVDLYADILRSSQVKKNVIKDCGLLEKLKFKNQGEALNFLSRITKLHQNIVGVFTIEVEYRDPEIVTCVANSYAEELDRFLKEQTMSQGKNLRIFLEKRIKEVTEELKRKEDTLTYFQKRHNVPIFMPSNESNLSAFVELGVEAMKKTIELDYLKSYSGYDNPRVQQIEKELQVINSKLNRLITSGYLRHYAEYQILQEVYVFLKQQYEQARIMEVKDTPVLSILEKASIPQTPSFPPKKILVVTFFIVGIAVSVFYTLISVMWYNIKQSPSGNKKFMKLKEEIKKLFKFKK